METTIKSPTRTATGQGQNENASGYDFSTQTTELPVLFTRFYSAKDQSKTFTLGPDGSIQKTYATPTVKGRAYAEKINFFGLGPFLERLESREAVGFGVFDTQQYGPTVLIETKRTLVKTMGKANSAPSIARSKEYFHYSESPGVLMLDHDPSPYGPTVTPDGMIEAIAGFFPSILDAARWVRGSVSSGVHLEGEEPRQSKSFHVYFAVLDASEIPRFGAVLFTRLWLAGQGFIALSSSGAMLERGLIDAAVFSPERLDFQGAGIANPPLTFTPPKAQWKSGGYLDTSKLPDLTPEEEARYRRLVEEKKAAIQRDSDTMQARWVEAKTAEMVEKGADRDKAKAQAVRIGRGGTCDLGPDYVLRFTSLGSVTVAEVLADLKKFDKKSLADPIEGPGYGATTATFFANAGRGKDKPVIHSFAHGEQRYFLKSQADGIPGPVKGYVEKIQNNNLSYTSYTSNTGKEKSYTKTDSSYTKPAQSYTESPNLADFTYADDKGTNKLVVESDGAKILADSLHGEFAYNAEAGEWHRFEANHWGQIAKTGPEKAIVDILYSGTQPIGFRQSYLNGVAAIMLKGDMLPLPMPEPGKIPFSNGLLDVGTGALEQATHKNALTWRIPHDHKTGTECPKFKAWLATALGDDAGLTELLRAFINACLLGRADLQIFLFLKGPGGTGKSTFLRILTAILGASNCVSTDLKNLETNRFEAATLYGKRLAVITDAGRYTGSVDQLKAITGQDAIRNEKKHVQQCGTFIYEGMVVIASNEYLASTDYSSGLDRRRVVVELTKQFTATEKAGFEAKGGEDALQAEIPAIINWALAMTREEVTKAFRSPPDACRASTLEALYHQNPVADWIQDNLASAPGQWCMIGIRRELKPFGGGAVFEDADTKLYPNYLMWCKENGREALSMRRFRSVTMDMLRTLGHDIIEARRGAGQGIQGIKIMTESERCRIDPTPSVGRHAPEPAPVLEVVEVQDLGSILFQINSSVQTDEGGIFEGVL